MSLKLFISLVIIIGIGLPNLLSSAEVQKQDGIEILDWNISFKLPSDKWKLYQTAGSREENKALYLYIREAIFDSKGTEIIPTIGFNFSNVNKEQDLIAYSTYLRSKTGLPIEEIFTHEDGIINLKNAVGYSSKYTDSRGTPHTVKIIHAISGESGIEIIMDCTSELFNKVETEYDTFMKSLNFIK